MSARSLASPQSAGEQKKKLADSLIKKFNKKFNGPLNNPHLSSIIVAEVGKLLQKAKISPGDLEQVEAKISREAVSESSAVLRNEDVRLRKIKAEMSSKGGLPAALLSKEDRKILPKELKKTIASPKKKPAARVSVNMLENTVRARNAQLDKQKAKHTSVFSSLGMVGPATPDSDAGNILVGAKSLPLDQAVDPWSVLVMHDVKKYEDEKKQREEQKRLQREQWKRELDDQVKINERKKKEAAMEEVKYAEEEQDQLRVADIQEKKKKEAKMMINTKLKEERAKTVAELQEQKRRQLEEQKEEEKSEVRRMEAEIARAERRQQRKREEEAERAKRLQEENKEQRKMREEERKKKHRMDLEYAASQARMLDDLERRRLEALGKIKDKMKTIEVMGDTLGHSILEKEEEDERRAEMWRQAYEKKQLKIEREREERIEKLRQESILSLEEQKQLRELERQKQKLEEDKMAIQFKAQAIKARQEAEVKERMTKEKYLQYKRELEKDIQRRAQMTMEADRLKMTKEELELNRHLLEDSLV